MGSYNSATIVGNLGRDAELRYTQGGAAVATLNVATTDNWTDKQGQKQSRTEWHRIVLWGKQAESLKEYLTKGKQILVDGSLQTRKWTDKDGVERYTTEIKAFRVVLLGGGNGSRGGRRPEPDENTATDENGDYVRDEPRPEPITDDDIPFAWLMPLLLPALAFGVSLLG